ncbi:hypothetical protein NDU88_005252 [Pleurodeles waltl]|uniref:Uncharacterized protein n=1 Tax=Pleurodeles waltl TaxID=8319 RepID=A0AAV7L2J7_PLEWA|nr:hypothetical protein NDU88_005252 [Pleurodeles waltl]
MKSQGVLLQSNHPVVVKTSTVWLPGCPSDNNLDTVRAERLAVTRKLKLGGCSFRAEEERCGTDQEQFRLTGSEINCRPPGSGRNRTKLQVPRATGLVLRKAMDKDILRRVKWVGNMLRMVTIQKLQNLGVVFDFF